VDRHMEIWELVARERVRDALARYNWSGDAGRLEALAETFCADGVLEIRGSEPLRGRAEIAAFLGGVTGDVASAAVGVVVKPVVRHILTNVIFNELTPERAEVSSYFTVVTHIGLDHFGRYRDTLVPDDGGTWLIKHRKVSTDWSAADSTMARSKSVDS
jgi:SnoaL-like domain